MNCTLRLSSHQPVVVFGIYLGFLLPRVLESVKFELFCQDAAEVSTDLRGEKNTYDNPVIKYLLYINAQGFPSERMQSSLQSGVMGSHFNSCREERGLRNIKHLYDTSTLPL